MNGDEMVDLLISVILEALVEKYSINGNQNWVVELDSSTEEKFSRHLIMCIPKIAFKDNSHVGAFVAEKLLLLPGSIIKAGKNSFLLPTGCFKCKDMGEDMFMASLICNIDVDCEKLLVCKMELDCEKTLHFETEVTSNCGRYCKAPQENTRISDVSTTNLTGKSPFPSFDEFIESIASTGNISACQELDTVRESVESIRAIMMTRNIHLNCTASVMYVVDMRRAAYYQKCYDPDCKGV
ncbi:hypothetical protein CRYUN_Cryun07bG0108400 [Craigia yunnanensis]